MKKKQSQFQNTDVTNILGDDAFWKTNKAIAKATSNDASLLLADLISKRGLYRTTNNLRQINGINDWFYATVESIETDCNIPRRAQERCLVELSGMGFVRYELHDIPRKRYFNIDDDAIASFLLLSGSSKTSKISYVRNVPAVEDETYQQYGTKRTNSTGLNVPTTKEKPNKETTTKKQNQETNINNGSSMPAGCSETPLEHNTINIRTDEQLDADYKGVEKGEVRILPSEPITSDLSEIAPEVKHNPIQTTTNGRLLVNNQESQLNNSTQNQLPITLPTKQTAVSHSTENKAVHNTIINTKEKAVYILSEKEKQEMASAKKLAVLVLDDMHPEVDDKSRVLIVDAYVSFLLSQNKKPTTNPKWMAENAFNMHLRRKGEKVVSYLSAAKQVDYPVAKGQIIDFQEKFEKSTGKRLGVELKSMMTDYIVNGKTTIKRIINICDGEGGVLELNAEEKRIKEGLIALFKKE